MLPAIFVPRIAQFFRHSSRYFSLRTLRGRRVLRWAVVVALEAIALLELYLFGPSVRVASAALLSGIFILLIDRFPWAVTSALTVGVISAFPWGKFTVISLAGIMALALLVSAARSHQAWVLGLSFPLELLLEALAGHPDIAKALATMLLLGAFVSWGLALRRSRERVRRAEAAGAEALRAQRALIARELHDTLARTNTQIVLWARQARALGPPDERVAQALDEIIAAGCSSVRDLRAMLRVLRQEGREVPDLVPLSSLSAAEAFAGARRALEGAGLRASVTCDGDLDDLPSVVATTLVRCLEESVANMVKYAAADAQCTIRIEVADGEVGLLVVNPVADGRRPDDAVVSSGYGLLGMQERASLLGGRLTHTDTGHQWVLALTLPLNPGDTP
ncbi:sensor histidine kinase [Actinomyces israelii]|uniref:sensor histidine kinase n=1 Tax=Actinomyces israelii TaxID=1659 RepID=UPI00255280D9|nr:histidine kinase [Actinomyces israelii]